MSRGLHNFQTYFDDCCSINGNFDSHVTVASPSASFNSNLVHKRETQYMQHSKMPALLRLDSVGEVSSDSRSYNRADSKPVLRNCISADSDLVSRANRFLTKSNMASSVKSFTQNPGKFHSKGQRMSEPIFTNKAHSFSQTQMDYGAHKKNQSSSLDFFHQGTVLDQMFSKLTPARINGYNKLCCNPNRQDCTNIGANLQSAVGTYMGGLHEGKAIPAATYTSSPSILSTIAAAYTASMLPSYSCSAPVQSQSPKLLVSETKDSTCVPFVATSELSVTKANKHDESIKQAETLEVGAGPISNTLKKVASDQCESSVMLSENVTEERQSSQLESPSSSERIVQLSCDSQPSEVDSQHSDFLQCDNYQKCTFDDTPYSSNKSAVDLSSVLSAPRKTVKKGRPSSKKQKKRQRQKRKHESSGESSNYSHTTDGTDEDQYSSECPKITFSQLEDVGSSLTSLGALNSQLKNSLPLASSPVKVQSNWCPIASYFFGHLSDFEETNDDSDDSEGSSEWSDNEDENTYISPLRCQGFNVALNLDLIFKRKSIPSLKSVLKADESESESDTSPSAPVAKDNHSQSLSTFTDDSFDDSSVEFCVPLTASDLSLGFTTGLSVDSLFTKKPCVGSQAGVQITTYDIVDGLSPSDSNHQLSNSLESCLEVISQVNAKWDQNYPSAGFRSCQSVSEDEIKDSRIKVHFAKGTNLWTVHIVGTEERGGTWHHFALDRERFQRRILDLEKVISPVLEVNHRAKILERNQSYKNSIEINNVQTSCI